MEASSGTVDNYRFTFYSPNEIRALSVLEVTNDSIFDSFTGRVIDRGLHDLDMGPCTDRDLCIQCGFDYLQCPGHMGHIEFSKPVYNPLIFDLVVRLLKSFCFKCFRINEDPILVGCLKLLGFPEPLLPYQPKQSVTINLTGLSVSELRRLALKEMTATSRTLCKRCNTISWMSRHLNHQQIEVKPAKETKGRISRAAKKNEEQEETFEPGEVEVWAELEALTNPNAARPVVTFEEGVASRELDDLLESVRERLKEICPNAQKFGVVTPDLVRDMLRCVWMQDAAILRTVLPFLNAVSSKYQYATDVFFMDVMPVSPNICRWPKRLGGSPYESSVTALLSRVLTRSKRLKEIYEYLSDNNWLTPDGRLNVAAVEKQSMGDSSALTPARSIDALNSVWVLLQAAVNGVYDMTRSVPPTGLEKRQTAVASSKSHPGFKQLIDKKEGWFRARIMGKRVQFSCRSVISPDPNLCVHEVGVPVYFAQRLYFPERVTSFNIDKLRALVIAGPGKYPGALALELPDGKVQNIPAGDSEEAVKRRVNMAQRLVTCQLAMHKEWPTIVRRHLEDGDYLLMNRQPTLHKPSMQAHKVRVIKAPWAKTLRLHYAICKAYNADFDGDEMNGHFPQSYQAKAELTHLSAVPFHYLAPKDGAPLAGLIQDHVIAAAKLTMRDVFLTEAEYFDLVHGGIIAAVGENGLIPDIALMPPCILKPQRLWTGKQVISTLLMNIAPDGLPYLSHYVKGKNVKVSMWVGGNDERSRIMNDVDLVIVDGYLASGMLDKAHIGSAAGGLVHSVYEAYGPHAAAQLLSGISRLSDRFLKSSSFTMSIADLMLTKEADKTRKTHFKRLDALGCAAFSETFNESLENLTKEKICDVYRKAQFAKSSDEAYDGKLPALDQSLGKLTHKVLDDINKVVLPYGLYKEFILNSLHRMVAFGSKGGMVSCCV
ncbi:unnamed protein product [Rodentolepis nana]|uniref:DNA-directed RNA polymerase subunit n=1 Tax=Rodentolepis nana TaxID=102285 RepID=A0A0R3TQ66_RODNA|nr:unnamed protein product [Rodentolepis nana]